MKVIELGVLALPAALLAGQASPAPVAQTRPELHRAAIIRLHGDVDSTMLESVRRRIAEARNAEADVIVFDVDTYGGEVMPAMEIGETIFHLSDAYTIAFVSKKAISAGALIAMSCREIVMGEGTEIGDVEPIYLVPGGGGFETAPEKIQSPLRAKFRKYAERNGVPIALAEAMVTKELGAVRMRFAEEPDRWHYMSVAEADKVRKERERRDKGEESSILDQEVIVESGRLLTVHSAEALRFGIAREEVKSRQDLLHRLGVRNADTAPLLEETGLEKLARFLQAYKFLLFIIGVVGLYLEFKTPGFGVPGIVGLSALALYFASAYIVNLAQVWEIALFGLGILLLALEIFVFPGFGLPGILGIACILISFYAAGNQFFIPNPSRESYAFELAQLRAWILRFTLSLLAIFVLAAVLSRYLPHVPIFRRLILLPEGATGVDVHGSGAPIAPKDASLPAPGEFGVAITALRPAGKALFGERRLDVMAEGDFVPEGARVRVLEVSGNRIMVRLENTIS